MTTVNEWLKVARGSVHGSICSDDEGHGSWLVVIEHFRDSGLLESCNFAVVRRDAEQAGVETTTVRAGSCLVGWIEALATPDRAFAEAIQARLESYPVLDEDALFALETEESDRQWDKRAIWNERKARR